MPLTLQEVKNLTDEAFGKLEVEPVQSPLVVPETWRRKFDALRENHLWRHVQSAMFDMRCEQATKLGFAQLDSGDMVEMLMGSRATSHSGSGDRQVFEWMYNHHTDTETSGKDCTWGGLATDFVRNEEVVTGRFLKRKTQKEVWRCRFGKLNYLQRDMPYGVILRMLEIKKLKLFNAFNVCAPIEAWERRTDIDPIVVASIFEITSEKHKEDEYNTAGQVAHFFVAQW
ncbi:MAG: hypothetical protein M0R80_08115 [Proteobacteria bacterium]|jgi:hypothetical protein|nr:hypothetical protein [Pseudomonadota bacterium]